jgi:hypothetical protein
MNEKYCLNKTLFIFAVQSCFKNFKNFDPGAWIGRVCQTHALGSGNHAD